jgi:hypothetical protein
MIKSSALLSIGGCARLRGRTVKTSKKRKRAATYARFSTDLQNERLIETGRCIMAKKASKLNPEASVCKYVAKYGLAAHLFYNPDGSVVAVKLSKLDTEQHADNETSEDLRKLL